MYPSSQVLFSERVGNHFRPQNNYAYNYYILYMSYMILLISVFVNIKFFNSSTMYTLVFDHKNCCTSVS